MSVDLDNTRTHDCPYTRGYESGFVVAMIATRIDFTINVLASHLDALRELIGSGADIDIVYRPLERSKYGVRWCRLEVRFR